MVPSDGGVAADSRRGDAAVDLAHGGAIVQDFQSCPGARFPRVCQCPVGEERVERVPRLRGVEAGGQGRVSSVRHGVMCLYGGEGEDDRADLGLNEQRWRTCIHMYDASSHRTWCHFIAIAHFGRPQSRGFHVLCASV
jgi:hypothetical protein